MKNTLSQNSFYKNLPNSLTIVRILIVPCIVVLLFMSKAKFDFAAGILFFIASITDYFDGYIARATNSASKLGSFLDPVADKLLTSTTFLMLAHRGFFVNFDILFVVIIIFRDIFISDLREFIKFPVSKLAKWKTFFQMISVSLFMIAVMFDKWYYIQEVLLAGRFFLWIAAINSLISCINYLLYCFDSLRD